MPHLAYTLLLAVLIAATMAVLGNRPVRERVYLAMYIFLSCTTAVIGGAWIMVLIHG